MNKYRKALKNYSTNASINKILMDIQAILSDAGAIGVAFLYENGDGKVSGIVFQINVDGNNVSTKVPFLVKNVSAVLTEQRRYRNEEHSYRVAIANIRDWLDAQMAMLATRQVSLKQLFLPYMSTNTGQTVYEMIEEKKYLQLTD